MIRVIPLKKESRLRDRKRKRILVQINHTIVRLPKTQAKELWHKLGTTLRTR